MVYETAGIVVQFPYGRIQLDEALHSSKTDTGTLPLLFLGVLPIRFVVNPFVNGLGGGVTGKAARRLEARVMVHELLAQQMSLLYPLGGYVETRPLFIDVIAGNLQGRRHRSEIGTRDSHCLGGFGNDKLH